MSFSGDVKAELASRVGVARHCRIAELAALIGPPGEEGGRGPERPEVAEKAERLLRLLRVRQPRQILGSDVGAWREGGLSRDCCRRAYLRGAFLAAGSVSDPERSYHFEILCGLESNAEHLCELIRGLGVDAHVVRRKRYHVVYVKESSQIADLLGLMGANASLLRFESARVVKEVRGNVNRKVNCETANINKTANAAAAQIEDIRRIRQAADAPALPAGLDEIATLRVQYPEATLAELGRMMDPPIGKSGVNHRLRRLSRIAKELCGK